MRVPIATAAVDPFHVSIHEYFMALGTGLNILALILVSWVSGGTFAQNSYCSIVPQTVTASKWHNTTITSPNYPMNYGNNLNCTWLIEVSSEFSSDGYILKVTFNDLQISVGEYSICHDKLEFYDGNSTLASLLGSYCGTVPPQVIYSTGQLLYIKFKSDGNFSSKGFSFNVSAVLEEEAAGICRKTYGRHDKVHQLSGSSGTIFSPDYPVPYPPASKCTWVISVPAGKRVKLTFEDFNLRRIPGVVGCKERFHHLDYVEIRDGQLSESKELAFFCGSYMFQDIYDVYSTGNYMRIKFYGIKLSIFDQSKGFKASYEVSDLSPDAYSKEICYRGNVNNNKLKLTGTNGTLQSPEKKSTYPPDMSCDWLITVPDGKVVKLSFDRFELEPSFGAPCTEDYVEIRDGKGSYSESKGRFCGFNKPEDIRSSGRYMRVSFRSDSDSSYYDGFKATFTAADESSSPLTLSVWLSLLWLFSVWCVS